MAGKNGLPLKTQNLNRLQLKIIKVHFRLPKIINFWDTKKTPLLLFRSLLLDLRSLMKF